CARVEGRQTAIVLRQRAPASRPAAHLCVLQTHPRRWQLLAACGGIRVRTHRRHLHPRDLSVVSRRGEGTTEVVAHQASLATGDTAGSPPSSVVRTNLASSIRLNGFAIYAWACAWMCARVRVAEER